MTTTSEAEKLTRLLNNLAPHTKALVASPCRGVGANRSVVLIQHNGEGRWTQAIKCWDGDHQLRARVYVDLINRAAECKRNSRR